MPSSVVLYPSWDMRSDLSLSRGAAKGCEASSAEEVGRTPAERYLTISFSRDAVESRVFRWGACLVIFLMSSGSSDQLPVTRAVSSRAIYRWALSLRLWEVSAQSYWQQIWVHRHSSLYKESADFFRGLCPPHATPLVTLTRCPCP